MEYYVNVEPGVKVYVNDINPGGKKTILFMHGWPANHKLFEYQYNELIYKGYRCIGVDLRGFGKSDKPINGYNYNRLADDLRRIIQALKLKNITLLGHSVSGAIAVRYMARHGGYGVSKLILCAAAAPSLIQRPDFQYGLKKADVEGIIQDTFNDRPNMLRNFGEMFFYHTVTRPFSDWFFGLGLEAASWSTMMVSYAWISEVLFDDLKAVRVPTLILHGVHDRICLYPLGIAQYRGIKGSKLIPFESSGHGLFYDEKEKFNDEVMKFVC